jgi:hypothetical protein
LDAGVPTEPRCDPVLIVGAGLSAADAIIAARFRSLPILHVFRKKAGALGKQLPENMYPEYHKVSARKLSSVQPRLIKLFTAMHLIMDSFLYTSHFAVKKAFFILKSLLSRKKGRKGKSCIKEM